MTPNPDRPPDERGQQLSLFDSTPAPSPESSSSAARVQESLPPGLFDSLLAADESELDRLRLQIVVQGYARAAAQSLANILDPRARRGSGFVARLFGRRYSLGARRRAFRLIRSFQQPVEVEPIIAAMWDRHHADIRREAARLLGEIGLWLDWSSPQMAQIVHALTIALRHQYADVRLEAARALGKLSAFEAEEALMQRLEVEKVDRVRQAVALALGSMRSADAVFALLDSYETGEIASDVCLEALVNLGERAVEPLISAVRRWNVRLVSRTLAAAALGRLKSRAALDPLAEIVRRPHEPEDIRAACARALADLGREEALPALDRAAREPDLSPRLARVLDEAIHRLRPPDEAAMVPFDDTPPSDPPIT